MMCSVSQQEIHSPWWCREALKCVRWFKLSTIKCFKVSAFRLQYLHDTQIISPLETPLENLCTKSSNVKVKILYWETSDQLFCNTYVSQHLVWQKHRSLHWTNTILKQHYLHKVTRQQCVDCTKNSQNKYRLFEVSLYIFILYWCFEKQQTKNDCLEQSINNSRLLQIHVGISKWNYPSEEDKSNQSKTSNILTPQKHLRQIPQIILLFS
jgi:hypothetical protein